MGKKSRTINGCTGKRRMNFPQALKARDWMKNKHPESKFSCYQCWCCGYWHVGTII